MNADLTARLLEAIAETEEAARAAVGQFEGPQWTMLGTEDTIYEGEDHAWSALEDLPRRGRRIGEHIVRHDPASVLRRCAADRRMVAMHSECGRGGFCDDGGHGYDEPPFGCGTLALLAEGYGINPEENDDA